MVAVAVGVLACLHVRGDDIRRGDVETAHPRAPQPYQVPADSQRRAQVAPERADICARRAADAHIDVDHRRRLRVIPFRRCPPVRRRDERKS